MKTNLRNMMILSAILLTSASADRVNESADGDGGWQAGYTRGVLGGPHDFRDPQRGPSNACSACHVPHLQTIRTPAAPTTQPATRMFRMVGQRRVFQPDRYMPGPSSLICLGCHDGTVATSTIGSSHALLAGVREGFDVPEDFVWRDHPIGVRYPKDRRNFRPESRIRAQGKIRLPEGRIECISCHDAHNTAGVDKMLAISNRRSALCLACHVK